MLAIFRVDASLQIGTGHVMRCLTLADVLSEHGAKCRFVCREEPGNLIELIRRRGFEAILLPVDGGEAIDWRADAEQTKVGVGETAADWLIVDHYALDARWERALRPYCRKLMVIDDLADRPHDCDLLLDQNLGRSPGDYKRRVSANCKMLLGSRYALLRPEFAQVRSLSVARRRESKLQSLLITMGGVDNDNITCKVLEALKTCSLPQCCKIKVVMGAHAPWVEKVRRLASSLPVSAELIVAPPNIACLMSDADLAIGASGSTSWERCCVGLPSILIVIAANQRFIAEQLSAIGAAKMARLGSLAADLESTLCQIQALPTMLPNMAEVAANLTDGTGACLVVQQMGVT